MSSELILTENGSSPSPPASGRLSLYAKNDGNLYSKNPSNVETLVTAGAGITALTGDVAATGPGSASATIQPNAVGNSKLAQAPQYTIKGNNTGSTANVLDLSSGIIIGVPEFTDLGIGFQVTGNSVTYFQSLIQNINAGSSSSTDFIVTNDQGTAGSFYGDFGMNSSTFTGTGSLSLPNVVYLYSQDTDLVLGTGSAHSIRFVTNASATDAFRIDSSNQIVTPSLTGYLFGNAGSAVTASSTIPNSGLASMADNTVKANKSGSSASPSDVALGSLSELTSSVLVITGTNTVIGNTTIRVIKSDSTHDGYLSSTDWNTFNGKQASLSIGSFSNSSTANGIDLSGATLTLHAADVTNPGAVSTGTQSFAGAKTFTGNTLIAQSAASVATIGASGSTANQIINGGVIHTTRTTTTNLVIDTTTNDYIILCNPSGAINLTLPVPTNGRTLIIKDISGTANTNNINILQHAAEKIEGLTSTKVLATNWGSFTLVSDGTDWFLI